MFLSRTDAGIKLAQQLLLEKRSADIVLGLARGGVEIAFNISRRMEIPLDVLVVKKLGSPGNPELAIGAVAPDGMLYLDTHLARTTGAQEAYVKQDIKRLLPVIREKTALYRNGKGPLLLKNKTVILTDDGAATGATMFAAIRYIQRKGARKIIAALPVASPDIANKIRVMTAEVSVLESISDFGAVGEFYKNFPQLTDEDVVKLLT